MSTDTVVCGRCRRTVDVLNTEVVGGTFRACRGYMAASCAAVVADRALHPAYWAELRGIAQTSLRKTWQESNAPHAHGCECAGCQAATTHA